MTALANALLRAGVVADHGNAPGRPVASQQRKITVADLKPTTRPPQLAATPRPVAKPPPKATAPLPAAACVPQSIRRDGDGFPCGWCFERNSWGFHRSLWFEHGVRAGVGDYTGIVRQGKEGTAWSLSRNVWRVQLRTLEREINVGVHKGEPVVVLPDEDWREHIPWVDALALHLPDPASVPCEPRVPRVLTEAQRAHRKRKAVRRAGRLKTPDGAGEKPYG